MKKLSASKFLRRVSAGDRMFSNMRIVPDGTSLAKSNCQGICLNWSDLTLMDLTGTPMSGIDAYRAKFHAADMSEADFSNSNMSGASFMRANLSFTNLFGCLLRGADFREAMLRGTNFCSADITGAIFNEDSIRYLKDGEYFGILNLEDDRFTYGPFRASIENADLEWAQNRVASLRSVRKNLAERIMDVKKELMS